MRNAKLRIRIGCPVALHQNNQPKDANKENTTDIIKLD